MHDAADRFIDLFARHGAFFQRLLHASAQLGFIKGLACGIALDHQRHEQFGGLERGETLAAFQALAAAPYLPPLAGKA